MFTSANKTKFKMSANNLKYFENKMLILTFGVK